MYATTEALAYETDKARVLDNTLPDITQQDSVIQKLVAQFDEVFGVVKYLILIKNSITTTKTHSRSRPENQSASEYRTKVRQINA